MTGNMIFSHPLSLSLGFVRTQMTPYYGSYSTPTWHEDTGNLPELLSIIYTAMCTQVILYLLARDPGPTPSPLGPARSYTHVHKGPSNWTMGFKETGNLPMIYNKCIPHSNHHRSILQPYLSTNILCLGTAWWVHLTLTIYTRPIPRHTPGPKDPDKTGETCLSYPNFQAGKGSYLSAQPAEFTSDIQPAYPCLITKITWKVKTVCLPCKVTSLLSPMKMT